MIGTKRSHKRRQEDTTRQAAAEARRNVNRRARHNHAKELAILDLLTPAAEHARAAGMHPQAARHLERLLLIGAPSGMDELVLPIRGDRLTQGDTLMFGAWPWRIAAAEPRDDRIAIQLEAEGLRVPMVMGADEYAPVLHLAPRSAAE